MYIEIAKLLFGISISTQITRLGSLFVLPKVCKNGGRLCLYATYSRQATRALTYGRTAADQADDEEKGSYCNYYDGGNQSVHVLEEVVVVVICDEHIGSDVA